MDFKLIFVTIFFYLPAYVANMMPVLLDRAGLLKSLAVPVDALFGKKEIFGPHKTWRGIIGGIAGGILTGFLQAWLFTGFHDSSNTGMWIGGLVLFLIWGALLGLGALLGDLAKSFFKRRLGIKPGGVFFPFDQLDFIIGAMLLGSLLRPLLWREILVLLIITPLLHFYSNLIVYKLGWKKVWW